MERTYIKCDEIPSNFFISEEHFDLVESYKGLARRNLKIGLFIGLFFLLIPFIGLLISSIHTIISFKFNLDNMGMLIFTCILSYLEYILVICYPLRIKRINEFKPNNQDSKCCYCSIEKVWSDSDSDGHSSYYATAIIKDSNLVIRKVKINLKVYNVFRHSEKLDCIVVNYDGSSTYLIPLEQ